MVHGINYKLGIFSTFNNFCVIYVTDEFKKSIVISTGGKDGHLVEVLFTKFATDIEINKIFSKL